MSWPHGHNWAWPCTTASFTLVKTSSPYHSMNNLRQLGFRRQLALAKLWGRSNSDSTNFLRRSWKIKTHCVLSKRASGQAHECGRGGVSTSSPARVDWVDTYWLLCLHILQQYGVLCYQWQHEQERIQTWDSNPPIVFVRNGRPMTGSAIVFGHPVNGCPFKRAYASICPHFTAAYPNSRQLFSFLSLHTKLRAKNVLSRLDQSSLIVWESPARTRTRCAAVTAAGKVE